MPANMLDIGCKNSVLDKFSSELSEPSDILRIVNSHFGHQVRLDGDTGQAFPGFVLLRGGSNRNRPKKYEGGSPEMESALVHAGQMGFDMGGLLSDGIARAQERSMMRQIDCLFESDAEGEYAADSFHVPVNELAEAVAGAIGGRRLVVKELSFDLSQPFNFAKVMQKQPEPYCWLQESTDLPWRNYRDQEHFGFAFYQTSIGLHKVRIVLDHFWESVEVVEMGFKGGGGFMRLRMPDQVHNFFQQYSGATLNELCTDYWLIPKVLKAVGEGKETTTPLRTGSSIVRDARSYFREHKLDVDWDDRTLFLDCLRQRMYVTFPKVSGTFEPVDSSTAELYITARS